MDKNYEMESFVICNLHQTQSAEVRGRTRSLHGRYDRYNILLRRWERKGKVIDRCKREENKRCPKSDILVLTKYVLWFLRQSEKTTQAMYV